ncbi:hypothetical protein BDA99DRAFT_609869 [Phascolomyces articulosus]|uniref:Uncharacterized protein n=1 Tax=Phascolomyces articulosus TaxID=60185 RepID=A0AAD5P965_9FUNG|nr:hypothetical protein BDA99DRAFT_609869 [Phascolomyces articulosus]
MNPTYKGPYKVVNKTKGGSYILKNYEGQLLPKNYPPDQLKLVRVLEEIPADEIYDLDGIVDHKWEKDTLLELTTEYQVPTIDYFIPGAFGNRQQVQAELNLLDDRNPFAIPQLPIYHGFENEDFRTFRQEFTSYILLTGA